MAVTKDALLVLRDGRVFRGEALGAEGETSGEVIFNTAMSGYQEILTDPSYRGQIVTMTYPMIGNYGCNDEDVESRRPWANGLIVKEASACPSSWRGRVSLDAYLKTHAIVGLQGIDTRALTRHLRTHGAQRGVVSTASLDREALVERARSSRSMVGLDLAREVTCEKPWTFDPASEGESAAEHLVPVIRGAADARRGREGEPLLRVVAYDFGMKRNILRNLAAAGCSVTVVPATTSAPDALALEPDGVFLSNGPGDPEPCTYAIEAARVFVDRLPVFGICLGHQILGLACGGKTYKLKFGHRGANHPVKNLKTGQVEITSQNHGFCVDPALFERPEFEFTHVNLNDGTVEGFRLRDRPVVSVQYHPEASPGPHDSHYLFQEFVALMRARREGR